MEMTNIETGNVREKGLVGKLNNETKANVFGNVHDTENRRKIPLKLAMAMEDPSQLVNAMTFITFRCGYKPTSYEVEGIKTIHQFHRDGLMNQQQLTTQLKMYLNEYLRRRDMPQTQYPIQ